MTAAILIVVALAGVGVMKYLSVHSAENTVSRSQATITSTNLQISKYDLVARQFDQIKTEQARADTAREATRSTGRASSRCWQQHAVRWHRDLPVGRWHHQVTATTAAASTSACGEQQSPHREDLQIASLSLTLYAPKNLPYFEIWVNQLVKSHALQVTSWSGFVTGTSGQVTYSAVISVLGTIQSSRLKEFEVIK